MYQIIYNILSAIGLENFNINFFDYIIEINIIEIIATSITLMIILATSILISKMVLLPFNFIHKKIHEWIKK